MEQSRILRLLLLASCLQSSSEAPLDDIEESFEIKYLKQYRYLSPLVDGNHNVEDALREFQQQSEIPVTGILDATTIKEMYKPRCGVPDRDETMSSGSGRVKRFSVSGDKWNKTTLTYKFANYASNGGLTSSEVRAIADRAFKSWEAISPLSFVDVTDNSVSDSDITLSFFAGEHSPCTFDFDGTGGALAHAFFPENGEIHFDDAETFTDGVATGTNFFSVALHEIGHALGLKHTQRQNAIMHAQYKPYDPNMNVTDDEKHGIQYIYGKYISGLEVYSSENSQWKVTAQGTVNPESTIAPGQCIDKYDTCNDFQSQCSQSSFMTNNCPQTCGHCVGQGASCGSDIWPSNVCSYLFNNNFCNVVGDKCKKTCNTNCNSG